MSKSDIPLKENIQAELLRDPKVNAAQIGVPVDSGAVSLFAAVDTYAAMWAAEDVTKRVGGVRTVAKARATDDARSIHVSASRSHR